MSTYVIIVDDDAALNRLTSLVLRSEGFQVASFTSPTEALANLALGEDEPAVVILDLAMADMDGRQFYGRFREAGHSSPVIILSAFGAQEAQEELGADSSLSKPFRPEILVALVRKTLAGRPPC